MLTQERLKELLRYEPETGIFIRRRTYKRWKAGTASGTDHPSGYVKVYVDGKLYRRARLAWLYMTGSFPDEFVDHINGVRNDDRWCNLRAATVGENSRNSKARKGLKGVFPNNNSGYFARISYRGTKHYLGNFPTPELAHAAYCAKAKELHGEFANAG